MLRIKNFFHSFTNLFCYFALILFYLILYQQRFGTITTLFDNPLDRKITITAGFTILLVFLFLGLLFDFIIYIFSKKKSDKFVQTTRIVFLILSILILLISILMLQTVYTFGEI